MKRTFFYLRYAGMIAILATTTQLFAGTDKEDANFVAADWTGASSGSANEWYVKSSDSKPAIWTTRRYLADSSLIATHAQKEDSTTLNHRHFKEEWGDTGCPSKSEADVYWNKRFSGATLVSTASKQHKTCHEYALTSSGRATGVYNYVLTDAAVTDAYNSDLTTIAALAVAGGDILTYGDHSTYVGLVRVAEGGHIPSRLYWKWLASGVYRFAPANDPNIAYDTPMNHCGFGSDVDTSETIADQEWSWDEDFRTNATVWH